MKNGGRDMRKGLLHKDDVEVEIPSSKVDIENYVTVQISDKSGHGWKASGRAGMAVIMQGNTSEYDAIGSRGDIVKLLVTALVKTKELLSEEVVEDAIAVYRSIR